MKACIAGGVLSMGRMVGAPLGVAVPGAFIGTPSDREAYLASLGHGRVVGSVAAATGAVVA